MEYICYMCTKYSMRSYHNVIIKIVKEGKDMLSNIITLIKKWFKYIDKKIEEKNLYWKYNKMF